MPNFLHAKIVLVSEMAMEKWKEQ